MSTPFHHQVGVGIPWYQDSVKAPEVKHVQVTYCWGSGWICCILLSEKQAHCQIKSGRGVQFGTP